MWSRFSRTFRGTSLSVTRSDEAGTAFEPVQTPPLPANNNGVSSIQGQGSLGPLDLFADMTVGTATGFMYSRVLAQFSLKASVGSRRKGATSTPVSLSLRDVGDPVPGAQIVVAGKHLTTNAKGLAMLTLASGPHTASASAPGYATVSVSFTVG